MYTYPYPRPALTADCVVICTCHNQKYVLLIQRGKEPFKHQWAFPGGFVEIDEDLQTTACRELEEETGLKEFPLHQFKTYGAVHRDPRGRVVSVVYFGKMEADELPMVEGKDDALVAQWFKIEELPHLAFDHNKIIQDIIFATL